MPKFMTYQRPAPVNKTSWSGRPGGNAYQLNVETQGRLVDLDRRR